MSWLGHSVHDDLVSSVQRHDRFHLSGVSRRVEQIGGNCQNGSDMHDAIGAYLRKIVTVDHVNGDHVPGPRLRLVWGFPTLQIRF